MSEAAAVAGHGTVFELFAEVKREVRPVGKDSFNQQQKFKFRGVDAVVNEVAAALDKHGVIITPHLDKLTYGTVEVGNNRTRMAHAQVEVTYTAHGPAGDSFPIATVPGEAMDSGDKATAKAMSVAFRIALLQALNLPTGDPDPDEQSYERSPSGPGDAWNSASPDRPGGNDRPDGQWKPRQDRQERPAAQAGPSSQGHGNSPGAPAGEDEWVAAFRERLAAAGESDLRGLRIEVARAGSQEGKISPQAAKMLHAEINQRRDKLSEPAA